MLRIMTLFWFKIHLCTNDLFCQVQNCVEASPKLLTKPVLLISFVYKRNGRHCVIRYAKPNKVGDALALLATDSWRILAGGTDFYPSHAGKPQIENVLDINNLAELRGISQTPEHWIIGASTTWTDLVRSSLPSAFGGLKQAALQVGSLQIQNAGTIAGNLCNASPAADGTPALLTLDAEVALRSSDATRWLSLSDFVLGNRKTARLPHELVTAIRMPKRSCEGRAAFLKLGARHYLVISIAMVAARIEMRGDRIAAASLAVGSCSAVAQRLRGVERAILGLRWHETEDAVRAAPMLEIAPIDDVRGSAGYRRQIVPELVLRVLNQVLIEAAETQQ